MDGAIPFGYYESLMVQTEVDFKNLEKSFEVLKNKTTDKKLILELCQNYSFLLQDIKYIEKFKENIFGLELLVSVRFLKDLEEVKSLLKEVKDCLIQLALQISLHTKNIH